MRRGDKMIHHKECCCYFAYGTQDEDCKKRYYTITDLDYNTTTLAVCNEYIRVRIGEMRNSEESKYGRMYIVDQVIRGIIIEEIKDLEGFDLKHSFLGDWVYNSSNKYDLGDRNISIEICQRPSVYINFSIVNAIEYLKETSNYKLKKEVKHELKDYLSTIRYKKYKTRYSDIIRMINKLDNCYGEEQTELAYNEIFLKILEYKIKNKN